MRLSSRNLLSFTVLLLAVIGCKSAYYGTRAMFGAEKRDILVERVKDARDDQAAAGKQFQTTLERFQEITNFQGGELEAKYKKFSKEYDRTKAAADDVKSRIDKVETVAKDLFAEWKDELKQYSDPNLRSSSEQKLRDTQARYDQLIAAMKTSAGKMDPVLKVFGDQVLYLKHQLNAAAISSLSGTAAQIETNVQALIRDLQKSIAEADAFINTMK
jgi:hypothetical protein